MAFLAALKDWFTPPPAPDPEVRKALDRACLLVDPSLRMARGFERKLAGPIQRALRYCDSLVASLPGPVEIDRQSFAAEPLVHALFATADDIAHMVGKSQAIRDYLQTSAAFEDERFYAMLAARRQRKKGLGTVLDGEVVRGDMPVEYLFFSDHILVGAAPTLAGTREALRDAAFDSLLKSFRAQVEALREERQTLRDDRDAERDRIGVLRGTHGQESDIAAHARNLETLEQRLREIIDRLQPEQLVAALVDFLAAPEAALRLEPFDIVVDRSGVVRDAASGEGDRLQFQQIIGRDRRRFVVLLAHMRRADAAEAVAEMKDMQQRYLIL